jgi:hypothetical protein
MSHARRLAGRAAALVCGVLAAAAVSAVWAAPESSPAWTNLTAAQRQALSPLQRDWSSLDANRKQKWLQVAERFPNLPHEERQRVQERMAEWARMTPAERASARLQFQQARQVPAAERQAQWQAYQALPADERAALAQAQQARKAARPAAPSAGATGATGAAGPTASPASVQTGKATATAAGPQQLPQLAGKRNIVLATPVPPAARTASPTVMQARPGATTTTMSTRAAPPAHHQHGLPKVVATPNFVDRTTMLPKRGPQGAAMRSAVQADDSE